MIAAPFAGPLADRYSRKTIIILGAIFWSALTLLTAVTHTYWELLVRHTLVGVGEATFVTIAPTFVADLFPESKRGRIFGIFYLAIPVGTAAGYLLGGNLGPHFGWRFPFYIAAFPGFLLAFLILFIPEPPRGQFDSLKETPDRATLRGLARNPHSGRSLWAWRRERFRSAEYKSGCRRFLSRDARLHPGIRQPHVWKDCGGRWHPCIFGRRLAGRPLLPRMKGSYYFVSAVSMGLGVPVMIVALFNKGPIDAAGHRCGGVSAFIEYFAAQRSAGELRRSAHPRDCDRGEYFHLPSFGRRSFANSHGIRCRPSLAASRFYSASHRDGYFFCHTVLRDAIRSSPSVSNDQSTTGQRPTGMSYFPGLFHWIAGSILGLVWLSRLMDAAIGMPKVADISQPDGTAKPVTRTAIPASVLLFPPATRKNTSGQLSPDY